MSRYLDPKADIVFKKIFGDHPHLLMSFLNAVLPLPADRPIVALSYLPNEQIPHNPEFKRTIADAKCTDSQGRVFIVEMQMNWTDSFINRLLFGTSQALVKQLSNGDDYHLLQPVYGLGLMAEIYEKTKPQWYHHYQLLKQDDLDSAAIEHLQLIFIELPKFPVHSPHEKQLRLLLLRFLREINEKTKEVSEELLTVPEIAEAVQLSEEAAYTPGELNVYEGYWDQVSREKTLMTDKYTEGLAEGETKGIEIGLEQGIELGLEKGIEQGIELGLEKGLELVAMNMLRANKPVDDILQLTGLSAETLAHLQKNLSSD